MLTGFPTSINQVKDSLLGKPIEQDYILYQYKNRKGQLIFAGESLLGQKLNVDLSFLKPSFNFYSPEEDFDLEVKQHLINAIQLNNFTFFIGHLSGIDYAVHSAGLHDNYTQSKIN